jgi:hypothetical protein
MRFQWYVEPRLRNQRTSSLSHVLDLAVVKETVIEAIDGGIWVNVEFHLGFLSVLRRLIVLKEFGVPESTKKMALATAICIITEREFSPSKTCQINSNFLELNPFRLKKSAHVAQLVKVLQPPGEL